MIKNSILFFSFFISVSIFGQTKQISLEDGVVQQYRKFRPDQMLGFQWIPDTNAYIYFENLGQKVVKANATDTEATDFINLADVNKALNTNLRSFFGLEWKDNSTIILSEGNKYYQYNVASKTGKLVSELPENAENSTFDNKKQNIAYTQKNNLYILNNSKEKITVTNESNEDIVSGQFIARNEFGI